MTEQETYDYICWAAQKEPARINAIGPETAAREYAILHSSICDLKMAPLGNDYSVREVTVMQPDGKKSWKVRIECSLFSRLGNPDE